MTHDNTLNRVHNLGLILFVLLLLPTVFRMSLLDKKIKAKTTDLNKPHAAAASLIIMPNMISSAI